ncbi:hypothetical protein EYF80_012159 [Liparis tanakae]|uniref:Uncharacterized protein n=1 Tax=Liparis tanakae TaxID=230148 RepID=A0A4Z2IHS9_9TELE|nr:hypothetical protein EYF80_012159 [Liparis tanakae]
MSDEYVSSSPWLRDNNCTWTIGILGGKISDGCWFLCGPPRLQAALVSVAPSRCQRSPKPRAPACPMQWKADGRSSDGSRLQSAVQERKLLIRHHPSSGRERPPLHSRDGHSQPVKPPAARGRQNIDGSLEANGSQKPLSFEWQRGCQHARMSRSGPINQPQQVQAVEPAEPSDTELFMGTIQRGRRLTGRHSHTKTQSESRRRQESSYTFPRPFLNQPIAVALWSGLGSERDQKGYSKQSDKAGQVVEGQINTGQDFHPGDLCWCPSEGRCDSSAEEQRGCCSAILELSSLLVSLRPADSQGAGKLNTEDCYHGAASCRVPPEVEWALVTVIQVCVTQGVLILVVESDVYHITPWVEIWIKETMIHMVVVQRFVNNKLCICCKRSHGCYVSHSLLASGHDGGQEDEAAPLADPGLKMRPCHPTVRVTSWGSNGLKGGERCTSFHEKGCSMWESKPSRGGGGSLAVKASKEGPPAQHGLSAACLLGLAIRHSQSAKRTGTRSSSDRREDRAKRQRRDTGRRYCNIYRAARGAVRHRDFGKVTLTRWRSARAGRPHIYLLHWRHGVDPDGCLPQPPALLLT